MAQSHIWERMLSEQMHPIGSDNPPSTSLQKAADGRDGHFLVAALIWSARYPLEFVKRKVA